MSTLSIHRWVREPQNPIFPPGGGWFDVGRCMNPFVVSDADTWHLFYSGADAQGRQRICLATAAAGDIHHWQRHGPLFEPGGPGCFDELWCVLPCVHRIGDRWHLYYTGRSAEVGNGLQSFWGIGLATSDDLRHWTRHGSQPVLRGDGFPQWPTNRGIAGGGPIITLTAAPDRPLYRMYYTLATGTRHPDQKIDQAKQAVVAHSHDGLQWFDKRLLLEPRDDAYYENAAVIALNPWRTASGWRALYASIGSRFGAYAICEATSPDGLHWHRGAPEENLALPPRGEGWESQMTAYPHVIREGEKLRLFYCGNGYGRTGIGTAVAEPIDPWA